MSDNSNRIKPQFVGEKICLNQVVLSLPASKAVIKKNAATEYADGLYPAFSASGQDVWLPDYRYDCNGVVVSAVGARCGKAFKASGKWNVVANTHPLALDEEKIDWDYAWRLLNNENWWIKSGSGQPFVKVRESLKRNIYLPPLSVQKKFAANLERVEKQIALTKQSLADLDSLVKSRFIEMFENEKQIVRLCDACDTFNGDRGSNYPSADERLNAGIPFINAGNLVGGTVSFNDMEYISEEKYLQLSGGKIQSGDLLYCLRGSLGKNALTSLNRGAIASSLMIIRCKQGIIKPQYLYMVMNSPSIKRQVTNANNGSSQPNLSAGSVKHFSIPLPPLFHQQEFSAFFSQVDKLRFKTQQQIEKLEMLKESLMQEYFG